MPSFYEQPKTSDVGVMQTTAANDSSRLSLGDLFTKGSKGANAVDQLIETTIPTLMDYNSGSGNRTGLQKGLAGAQAGFGLATDVIGSLGPVGSGISTILKGADWLTGKLGKKAKGLNLSETVGSSSGYTGLTSKVGTQRSDIDAWNKAGGITKGLAQLGGSKGLSGIDKETQDLKSLQGTTADILRQSKKKLGAVGTSSGYKTAQTQLELSGITGGETRVGKSGLKFLDKTGLTRETLKSIISKNIPEFKEGGKLNVIVDGKLHSQNHDLKNIDSLKEAEITTKGVPVIAMSEGGEIQEQSAEVEKNELILHLELTKQLEDLKEKGTDEAMIEAGKILSKEIVKNTKDSKDKILKNA